MTAKTEMITAITDYLERHIRECDQLQIEVEVGRDEVPPVGMARMFEVNNTTTITIKVNGGARDRGL